MWRAYAVFFELRTTQMENTPEWRFEVRGTIWYWEREDVTGVLTRMGPFPTFIACLVDAEKHGFDAAMTEERQVARARRPPKKQK